MPWIRPAALHDGDGDPVLEDEWAITARLAHRFTPGSGLVYGTGVSLWEWRMKMRAARGRESRAGAITSRLGNSVNRRGPR